MKYIVERMIRHTDIKYSPFYKNKSKKLLDGIVAAAKKHVHQIYGGVVGDLFGWVFVDGPMKNFGQATKSDGAKFGKWQMNLFEVLPRYRHHFKIACSGRKSRE